MSAFVETIVWTTLPLGRDNTGNYLEIAIFVSPRLEFSDPNQILSLENYPDFISWPDIISRNLTNPSIEYKYSVGNLKKESSISPELSKNFMPPDNGLWEWLFPATTKVQPFQFKDLSPNPIHSYQVRDLVAGIKKTYVATSLHRPEAIPQIPPNREDFPKDLTELGHLIDGIGDDETYHQTFLDNYENLMKNDRVYNPAIHIQKGPTAPVLGVDEMTASFFIPRRFYDRPEARHSQYDPTEPDSTKVPKPPQLEMVDFHQMIASLGDHPEILRKLWLVINLRIPWNDEMTGNVSLRFLPNWRDAKSLDICPWTACTITGTSFLPRAIQGIRGRRLNLQDSLYEIVQLDPDSAALKINHFTRTTRAAWKGGKTIPALAYDTPQEQGLPTLHSAGISVVQHERAVALHAHLNTMQKINSHFFVTAINQPPELDAGSILRGYRVDVRDETESVPEKDRKWRSLCQRVVTFPGKDHCQLDPVKDEGYLKAASATSAPPEKKPGATQRVLPDLYLHESLFRWDGWSLCAQRPGKTSVSRTEDKEISRPTGLVTVPVQHEDTLSWPDYGKGDTPVEHPTGLKLRPFIEAQPSSLPSLRFGHRYRLRVRTVDLAGNSEPFSEGWTSDDDLTASAPVTYYRFDPIPPPTLALQAPLTPGESVECMVIRSNYDPHNEKHGAEKYSSDLSTKWKEWEKTQEFDSPRNPDNKYLGYNARHVVPPKTSQNMAETHGMLDRYMMGGNEEAYKTAYNICLKEEGTLNDLSIVNIVKGDREALPPDYIQWIGSDHAPLPEGATETQMKGSYAIHREAQLQLPYLPDPFGRGAAFRFARDPAPTTKGAFLSERLPLTGDLVFKVPFIRSQTSEETWPSSYLPFRIRIEEGQGPIDWADPVLTILLPKAAVLRLQYSCYLNEEDLSLMGAWQWMKEGVKDAKPGEQPNEASLKKATCAGAHWMLTPFRELLLVHAVQQPLEEPEFTSIELTKAKIGDTFASFTRGTTASLSAKSTAKVDIMAEWSECRDDLSKDKPEQECHKDHHVCEVRIDEITKDQLQVQQFRFENAQVTPIFRHEFRDTRHRNVRYHMIATSRFREFFPSQLNLDFTRVGPKTGDVSVPNSARPDTPKVLYVVPTFLWKDMTEGVRTEHTREGHGLRVYLDRPWFSSGDDELLGVVLMKEGDLTTAGSADHLKPYISRCGRDPIWISGTPNTLLTLDHFLDATITDETNPTLTEVASKMAMPGVTQYCHVAVAGYQVKYDQDRKLWFCDIEIDPGLAYYPFVRLALARYQPYSRPDAHLSPVVLADFAQLTPDRTASVTWVQEDAVNVMVSGISPHSIHTTGTGFKSPENRIRVGVRIEVPQDQDILDAKEVGDLGWVTAVGTDYIYLKPNVQDNYKINWFGTITLPPKRGKKPMRLTVEEFEELPCDPGPRTTIGKPIARRVVFADYFPL